MPYLVVILVWHINLKSIMNRVFSVLMLFEDIILLWFGIVFIFSLPNWQKEPWKRIKKSRLVISCLEDYNRK